MNFMKVAQSVEAALFEACLWIALWPKTLWQVAARPGWVHDYVDGEAAKEESDQYDAFMSPAVFLAVTVVLWVGSIDAMDDEALIALARVFGTKEPTFDHKFGALGGIAMLLPMVFALVSTRAEKLELTRKNIQLSFRKHAYTTAAFWGLLLVGVFGAGICSAVMGETAVGMLAVLALFACMAWFSIAQSKLLAQELNASRAKGFGLTLVAGLTWTAIITVVVGIAAQAEPSAGPIAAADVDTEPALDAVAPELEPTQAVVPDVEPAPLVEEEILAP
jgi:hypothetical protein